jgi:hypothetical protein
MKTMNAARKEDLLSYEIQAQALRQRAIVDLARAALRTTERAADAVRKWSKMKRPDAPATLPA